MVNVNAAIPDIKQLLNIDALVMRTHFSTEHSSCLNFLLVMSLEQSSPFNTLKAKIQSNGKQRLASA